MLGVLPIAVLCLTACGSKPDMSFEKALDSVTHSSFKEIMNNAENYKQSFNITTELHIPKNNVDANISFSTENKESSEDLRWESSIAMNIEASGDEDEQRETIKIDWNAMIKHLPKSIYFKLDSLNIDWPEDFSTENLGFDLDWIKGKRFSLELTDEMLNEIYSRLPEDFDINEIYNEENIKKLEDSTKKLKDKLKNSINNEWHLVYSWIYSDFNWNNARKFSINKEKAFYAFVEYIETLIPEEEIDDFKKEIEEIDLDEIFENFPFKNLEWYFVITWKDRVQIVIENLNIEGEDVKMNWTFGRDIYEIAVKENGEDIFILSAKLKNYYYDVTMKVDNKEYLKWTITPKKSSWKVSINFDISINFEDGNDKINIPLKGWWNWEKISKFNVEIPKNSKNLMEDFMKNLMEDSDFMEAAPLLAISSQQPSSNLSSIETPIVAGWILAAALMPRMQSAQDRARDVARKTSLSQLQSAIVTYQWDKWMWPGMNAATKWISVSKIEDELLSVWMSSIPTDPEWNDRVSWLWATKTVDWWYSYLVAQRNWTQNAWFVLMAKTEVEWWSNWVVCENKSWLENWYITNDTDLIDIKPCAEITKWDSCSAKNCTYTNKDELRYILIY